MNRSKILWLIVLFCFLIAAFIRINNDFRFNPASGYDASGHLAYIFQIKSRWGIPLANEGWSTFHPPLYYIFMAGIWKSLGQRSPYPMHIIFRLVSTLANLGIAILVLLTIQLLWPQKSLLLLLGISFVLFVPVHIYSSSMIGNEQLTAFLISMGLWLLILYQQRPRFRFVLAILLGIVSGLALISKYTGILFLITILICLLQKIMLHKSLRKIHGLSLVIIIFICMAISGIFYIRNIVLFGHPFVLSQDYPVTAKVMERQPPGKRRCLDFLGFDLQIFLNPIIRNKQGNITPSRSRYVWSLVYSNFWFESLRHFLLSKVNLWRQKMGIILLWLGIFPTLLFVFELRKEIILCFKNNLNTPNFPLIVLFFLNLMAFIVFNIKTPHFSAAKATYFLSSSLPITIFMGQGTHQWLQKGIGYKVIGIFLLCLIFGLSSAAFFLTYT